MAKLTLPAYDPPADNLVHAAAMEAEHHIQLKGYRLIPLRLDEITPRENIAWLLKKDFNWWKAELIQAWREKPSEILPIVVAREREEWVILDGHHRWRAAKEAKVPVIWVLEAKGKLEDPNFRQRQRLEP